MKDLELLEPVTPGKILYGEFMKSLGISTNQPARDIAVPVVLVLVGV
ncbi:MAG: hypothetical protein GX874_12220 [Smithella sp.]|jgi:plasmid maintenance system antidote protein VapI|nr:hypothetical protein [Smithellaceae bacterium]NLA42141.1 hypothetical protein [Smithella sp.]